MGKGLATLPEHREVAVQLLQNLMMLNINREEGRERVLFSQGKILMHGRYEMAYFSVRWTSSNPSLSQVRVEGRVEKVSEEESDQYFHSRPRGSQIGAIVSPQSQVLPVRQALDDRYKVISEQYADGSYIPRPDCWGGFRLRPDAIEFWQGRESRLHDRLRFTREGTNKWTMQRLAP